MDDKTKRIEELVKEIQQLREDNSTLENKIRQQSSLIHSKNSEIAVLNQKIESMLEENNLLDAKKKLEIKRMANKIKMMEIEIRKNDVFREVSKGTSKTRKDGLVNEEIENLRRTNRILSEIMDKICKVTDFDPEIAKSVCELISDSNDPLFKVLLESIADKNLKGEENLEDGILNIE